MKAINTNIHGLGIHTNCVSAFTISQIATATQISIDDEIFLITDSNYVFHNRCSAIKIKKTQYLQTPEHLFGALALLNNFNVNITVENELKEFPVGPDNGESFFKNLFSFKKDAIFQKNVTNSNFQFKEDERSYSVEPSEYFVCKIIQTFLKKELYEINFSTYDLNNTEFLNEISKARTWVYKDKLEMLLKKDLCFGFENKWCKIVEEEELSSPKILRELTLHKLLDLIGDLYVLGFYPKIKLTVENPNHRLNNKLRNLLIS